VSEKKIGALLCLLCAFPAAVWDGYVLSILWGWFVVPLGLAAIGKAHAYGICVVLGLARYRYEEGEQNEWGMRAIMMFVAPAIYLFCGYAAHWFMQ